ncbi:hypothetical protein BKD82_03870 [Corynebacterium diphtheriae]|uniref:hypothetical protein n=1 Tax=Corynebacterium diphtheriae TaxID=1717 RepID=UPI0008939A85|nr:hypothetical protein [Corynebacterium diphtheriae]OFI53664.1 hypothetical protein BKD82_03870 [Corynebacterium diphtheriae]
MGVLSFVRLLRPVSVVRGYTLRSEVTKLVEVSTVRLTTVCQATVTTTAIAAAVALGVCGCSSAGSVQQAAPETIQPGGYVVALSSKVDLACDFTPAQTQCSPLQFVTTWKNTEGAHEQATTVVVQAEPFAVTATGKQPPVRDQGFARLGKEHRYVVGDPQSGWTIDASAPDSIKISRPDGKGVVITQDSYEAVN